MTVMGKKEPMAPSGQPAWKPVSSSGPEVGSGGVGRALSSEPVQRPPSSNRATTPRDTSDHAGSQPTSTIHAPPAPTAGARGAEAVEWEADSERPVVGGRAAERETEGVSPSTTCTPGNSSGGGTTAPGPTSEAVAAVDAALSAVGPAAAGGSAESVHARSPTSRAGAASAFGGSAAGGAAAIIAYRAANAAGPKAGLVPAVAPQIIRASGTLTSRAGVCNSTTSSAPGSGGVARVPPASRGSPEASRSPSRRWTSHICTLTHSHDEHPRASRRTVEPSGSVSSVPSAGSDSDSGSGVPAMCGPSGAARDARRGGTSSACLGGLARSSRTDGARWREGEGFIALVEELPPWANFITEQI
eukprot:scaffold17022_cov105-Isochrysis_galbana.AAC.2